MRLEEPQRSASRSGRAGAIQQPHKLARGELLLPSQTLESGFSGKVLAQVRKRRAWHLASCSARERSAPPMWPAAPQQPQEASGTGDVRPKYLSSSLVHQHQQFTRTAKLAPIRPYLPAEPQSARSALDVEEPGFEIVEAPTSLVVNTEQGTTRIPPHNWLILDTTHVGSVCEGGFEGREARLWDSAGSGSISEGAALLRLVSRDRLHAVAAEANFQRASRGTSELALRHAAHALELLGHTDRELPGIPRSTPSVPSAAGAALPPAEPMQADEVSARLQRMQAVVASQAAAAMKRAMKMPPLQAQRTKSIEPPYDPSGSASKRSMLQRGFRARLDFLDFANRRYGNIVRAWWALDVEENMKLGEKLFVRRVIDLGFRGNVHALWHYLDSDHSGSVTMLELDPISALNLVAFKVLIDRFFDGDSRKAFQAMDTNRSGRVSKQEFIEVIKHLDYEGPAARLFEQLDRQGLGYVVESDLNYLQTWQPRPYLFCKPDEEGLQRLKDALVALYRSLFKAWRKALDRDNKMRVSWEEFCGACRRVSRSTLVSKSAQTFLSSNQEIAGVWRALDMDCSGWVSLREFDPVTHQTIAEFKRWAEQAHGSACNAFRQIDGNSNGKVQLWEMQRAVKPSEGYTGNVELLFDCLDVNSVGFLTESDFRLLDNWDLDWEDWEARLRNPLLKRLSQLPRAAFPA